jgi:phosphoribosylpyrophosphate synthetase
VASLHNTQTIFEQISVIWALPRYRVNSLNVVLPYFPTGTMERVDTEGQIATAYTLAKMLSTVPMTCRGPVQYMIYDIHALQERFYFSENVIPRFCVYFLNLCKLTLRLETAIPLLLDALEEQHVQSPIEWNLHKLAIAFPDEGAQKRFSRDFPKDWHRIMCLKVREGDKRIVRLRDGRTGVVHKHTNKHIAGDPKGKDVLIVDDLVQTGNTLLETVKVSVHFSKHLT